VTVLVTLLLARVLGTAGFGVFSYAIAWAALLAVPALLGLEQLIVRDVAAAEAQGETGRVRGMIEWSVRAVALVSVVCAVGGAGLLTLIGLVPAGGEVAFWVAMALVPLTALARALQAAVRGLRHVVAGFLPELAVMPIGSLALVALGAVVLGQRFDAVAAVWAHVAAALAGLVAAGRLLARRLPSQIRRAQPVLDRRAWFAAAMPLLMISGMHVINRQTDVVMLGVLEGVTAAGIFAVAARGVQLILFVTYAVHAPLAPRVAALYATGDMAGLQRVATASARVILAFSAAVALGFIVFGPWLLGFFGDEFTAGAPALAILSVGHLLGAAGGVAGLILLMTGHERAAAVGTGVGAAANVVLNALLIPMFGLAGAATATATATALTALVHVLMVRRRLPINPLAFGPTRHRPA
jgi:O-antigen/teichoic acid export membrane protein